MDTSALEAIEAFHREVDAVAARLAEHHAARMQCKRGCSSCCVDDIAVFPIEAARISAANAELLEGGEAHPAGACAFLDAEGACRIYRERPYVCRTQGLPLSWIGDEDGQLVERRDICELNEPGGPPLVELRRSVCWPLGPAETKLAALQAKHGAAGERVRLRDMFRRR
jgi:Fe-S-cluster containining protein